MELSVEERKALAKKVRYRGKMEKFDVERAQAALDAKQAKGADQPISWAEDVEKSVTHIKNRKQGTLPPPTHKKENDANQTPLRNETIWSDEAFAFDVTILEIKKVETFTPTFARLPEIARSMYSQMRADDEQLDAKLSAAMLHYYSTAVLWARLIDLKLKNANNNLTEVEENYRQQFVDRELTIPSPLLAYILAIGDVKDKRGKDLLIADHSLPVAVVDQRSGYHANRINDNSHLLFEELPTLGVAGDVLMAEAARILQPVVPVVPPNTAYTVNLPGIQPGFEIPRQEVTVQLLAQNVTENQFHETVATTRLNVGLIKHISNTLTTITTFANKAVDMTKLDKVGSDAQLVTTEPQNPFPVDTRWTQGPVTPKTVSTDAKATVGASYYAGFQLKKPAVEISDAAWSTLQGTDGHPYVVPAAWRVEANSRRDLPQNYAEAQYAALEDTQSFRTTRALERMVISTR